MTHLDKDFLIEVFKTCLVTPTFMDVAYEQLQFKYFPTKPHKEVWRHIKTIYDLDGRAPTIGVLKERLKNDVDSTEILAKIKKCDVAETKGKIIDEFELFLRTVKFTTLYNEVKKVYESGEREQAISDLVAGADEIGKFSIKSKTHTTVFGDFEKRNERRKQDASTHNLDEITKIPFGIHPLDHYTRGGGDVGTSALVMAVSGGGKSTFLRWVGISAARLGLRVAHFQCEGTEDEATTAYDAAWTSIDLEDMELGSIPPRIKKSIKEVNQTIVDGGGEIYVVASEQFERMKIEECDKTITELERHKGKIHLAIFDYLELFGVNGNFSGETGERGRRNKIGEKITAIAVKHKLLSLSATQANDIKPVKRDDPDFVMTRSDISEFKGAVKPFSYFITINQTEDEYEAGIVRLHNDKFRKYKSGQTYRVAQSLSNSRFYDSLRTLNNFWDENKKRPK